MSIVQSQTIYANIYIAGDINDIKKVCSDYCYCNPLCVTITPTTFIYTYGREEGVIIGIINYPKFPTTYIDIKDKAFELAEKIRIAANQKSFTIQMPDNTYWYDLTNN